MVSSNGQALAPGLREIARLLIRAESSGMGFQPVLDWSETHPAWLDIEAVDPRAGGYTWTDADGSVLIQPAQRTRAEAMRERIWRDVDARADILDSVLADLTHDVASFRRSRRCLICLTRAATAMADGNSGSGCWN